MSAYLRLNGMWDTHNAPTNRGLIIRNDELDSINWLDKRRRRRKWNPVQDGGDRGYKKDEILYIVHSNYTGFKAAVIESGSSHVIIRSVYWGCGAYMWDRSLLLR